VTESYCFSYHVTELFRYHKCEGETVAYEKWLTKEEEEEYFLDFLKVEEKKYFLDFLKALEYDF
jgi:hypothetical protein